MGEIEIEDTLPCDECGETFNVECLIQQQDGDVACPDCVKEA